MDAATPATSPVRNGRGEKQPPEIEGIYEDGLPSAETVNVGMPSKVSPQGKAAILKVAHEYREAASDIEMLVRSLPYDLNPQAEKMLAGVFQTPGVSSEVYPGNRARRTLLARKDHLRTVANELDALVNALPEYVSLAAQSALERIAASFRA